eukprot:TRINITY_DN22_c3_g1_i3.p1 TRINITY_DN22_c3_g1~~TRINITY_DN22_c3_g1_i3.p1  ORF type:complete len:137 (-),score=39.57 TRINITY_DN22_c3_g1_i3:62-472(-)
MNNNITPEQLQNFQNLHIQHVQPQQQQVQQIDPQQYNQQMQNNNNNQNNNNEQQQQQQQQQQQNVNINNNSEDTVDRSKHPSGIVPTLQNIVSTVNLGCTLDLKQIALRARNAEYNPKRFAAVIMRIRTHNNNNKM